MKTFDEIIPDFSELLMIINERNNKHLEKFKWEWLKNLIIKWWDFYYKKYWDWKDKKEFLIWLYSDIVRYIKQFSEENIEKILEESTEIEMIIKKYHELIHDWDEIDTIEYRREISGKTSDLIWD